MTFTTFTFLAFVPIVFGVYWTLGTRDRQNRFLLAASYVFYGWWDWRFCALMMATTVMDFAVALGIERSRQGRTREVLLSVSILANLGVLGLFKYFNFFETSFAWLAARLGFSLSPAELHVVLPVGISFYTFQEMSYTIDVYCGRLRATRSLVDFGAFVSFFPHLVAGPIQRASFLLSQLQGDRRFDLDRAVDGCRQALWGFFKKMVLADNLGLYVDRIYGSTRTHSGPELALATVCFAFQIYYDFSAYSDIALGTARLFGFELMQNFRTPYFSQTPAEFWRRWHISLSTWFRDDVFFPLGASYGTRTRAAVNLLVTFLASGLWHGASWTFVAWGGLNGLLVLPFSFGRPRRHRARWRRAAGIVLTFLAITATWVFFRAATLAEAVQVFAAMVSAPLWRWRDVGAAFGDPTFRTVAILVGAVTAVEWWQREEAHPLRLGPWPLPARWLTYIGVLFLVLRYASTTPAEFIYFQF